MVAEGGREIDSSSSNSNSNRQNAPPKFRSSEAKRQLAVKASKASDWCHCLCLCGRNKVVLIIINNIR